MGKFENGHTTGYWQAGSRNGLCGGIGLAKSTGSTFIGTGTVSGAGAFEAAFERHYTIIIVIGFVASCMAKGFYFNITSTIVSLTHIFEGNNAVFLFGVAGFAFIVSALVAFISYKYAGKILFVVNLALSVVVFADAVYSRYYYSPLSIAALYQVGLLGPVMGSVADLLKVKDMVFFIDLPIFVALAVLKRVIHKRRLYLDGQVNSAPGGRGQAAAQVCSMASTGELGAVPTAGELDEGVPDEGVPDDEEPDEEVPDEGVSGAKPGGSASKGRRPGLIASAALFAVGAVCILVVWPFYNFQNYSNNSITKVMGVYYFHAFDAVNFVKDNAFRSTSVSDGELSSFNDFFEKRREEAAGRLNPYYGLGKGKNLLFLVVESLQQFVVGLEINGVEVTPNLNRFIEENIYFSQCYEQVYYGNTSDAEFILTTSVYPARSGSVFMRYSSNTYESLADILGGEGYYTYTAHANTAAFWNRAAMYSSLGYGKFIDINSYVIDEYKGWGGFALSDSSFFRQTIEMTHSAQPFFGTLLTLSGHHPYSYFADTDEFDAGEYTGSIIGNYLKAMHYTDVCLGELFEGMKEKGIYDNTVIVLIGDHYAIQRKDAEELQKLIRGTIGRDVDFSNDASWISEQTVPLVFRIPGFGQPERFDFACGQVDVMPTAAAIMGVTPEFHIGRDLFLAREGDSNSYRANGYALTRRGYVITDDFIYTGAGGQLFDRVKETISTPDAMENEKIQKIMQDLEISDMIIEKDILKRFSANNAVN